MTGRALLLLLSAAGSLAVLTGCNTQGALYHPVLSPSWSASRGKTLVEYYGCGACHVIGGIPNANGRVGPPLTHFARRYHLIAGVMPNTPDNVVRWIMDPPRFVPGVAMPALGIGRHGVEDITAYLYRQ